MARVLLLGREGSGKSSFGDFLFKACGDTSGRFSKRIRRGFAASESTCLGPLECPGKVFVIEAPSAALQSNELKKGREPGWLKELKGILKGQCKSEVDVIVYVHQISERFVQEDKEMLQEFDRITEGQIWDRFLLVFSHASEMGSTVEEEQRKFIMDVKESRGAPISFKWLMEKVGDRFETIDFAQANDEEKGKKVIERIKSLKSEVSSLKITGIYKQIMDKHRRMPPSSGTHAQDVAKQQQQEQREGRGIVPSLTKGPGKAMKVQASPPTVPTSNAEAESQETHTPAMAKSTDNSLRLLLVGLEGSGKSALGNFLLSDSEQKFEVKKGFTNTPKAACAHGMIFDKQVTIIDTPGLPSSLKYESDEQKEVWGEALRMAWKGGLDVVLYVHSMSSQFLLNHRKVLENYIVREYSWKKVLLVVSNAEEAGEDEQSQREFVKGIIESDQCPEALKWLCNKVDQQFIVVESVKCKPELRQDKIKEIFDAIQNIMEHSPGRIESPVAKENVDCVLF